MRQLLKNPAIYDCYPKFLRDSLLGTGDPMPNTIRRMTGAIADRFMLPQRGYLKEGYFADLTVFNEEEIRRAVPDQERSFGIEKVFINSSGGGNPLFLKGGRSRLLLS
jgi:N-acyl-D-amino-acid deacylase